MKLKTGSFLFLFSLSLAVPAQETATRNAVSSQQEGQADKDVTLTPLVKTSSVEVVGVSEPALALPVLCGSDDSVFVRMASITGLSDLMSISKDGKTVVRFSSYKMSDLTNPTVSKFFVAGADVYLLVTASASRAQTLQLKRPDGKNERQQSYTVTQLVARFKSDGTYMGAVTLDLPFHPLQIGAFPAGDFLVAGEVPLTHEPRLALVGSTGQFKRFVELEGDIHLRKDSGDDQSDNNSSTALPLAGKRFGEGFYGALRTSFMIQDGRSLLLVRKGQRTPIFSISPGGEVKPISLDFPSGFVLSDLRPAGDGWFAIYTHRISDTAGVEFRSCLVDRKTGKSIECYSYPRFLGFGIGCAHNKELTFLTRDNNKLTLTTVAAHRSEDEQVKSDTEKNPK